ncbi:MAG: MFS transporter [Planctomycetota bacterium]
MNASHHHATPLPTFLIVTFLASIGTGIFWLGIPFIAESQYGISEAQNLMLSCAAGATYMAGAFVSGRVIRRIERRMSPRTLLTFVLSSCAVLCLVPLVVKTLASLVIVACSVSLLSSFLWPTMESFLTAGRHGPKMRSAIGWFNLVWTSAVVLAMFGLGPFMSTQPDTAIVLTGVLFVVATILLQRFPGTPPPHHASQTAVVPPIYPHLLRSARALLPLSYLLIAAMSPLLPYRMDALAIEESWRPPFAAIWMLARPCAMTALWLHGAWHGRWSPLIVASVMMMVGFALVVAGSTTAMLSIGLIVFGAGVGTIYYAALYYAMAVGSAAVDAGGTHEALIGFGYTIGPLGGLLGLLLADVSTTSRVVPTMSSEAWIVVVSFVLIGIGGMSAVMPFIRSRREDASVTAS